MIDVQTPWREPPGQILARHAGRVEELHALAQSLERWAGGARPHPIYLWGPRGSGKSHLVSHLLATLRGGGLPGVRVLHLPEDVPRAASASDLLRRIDAADRGRFAAPRAGEPELGRAVVLVEGFDVHLGGLTPEEQKRLRHAWQAGAWWLVATGCSWPDALRSTDAAFYQAFSVWPLRGLAEEDAATLLDRLAGPAVDSPAWPARRSALIKLSGGSPRALTALGQAAAADPDAWASDHLLSAVQQLAAHYQHRLRDLSPQHQRVIDTIAFAPVELSAPEIAARCEIDGAVAAKACARLRDDGVLLDREGVHPKTWRIAEPMFRYWYEYRSASWEESRVALLGRLLESVLQPDEVIALLLSQQDEELGLAARRAATTPQASAALHERALRLVDGDIAELPTLLGAMTEEQRVRFAFTAAQIPRRRGRLWAVGLPSLALPQWAAALLVGFEGPDVVPKQRFLALVKEVGAAPARFRTEAALLLLRSLRSQLDQRGAPWQLGPNHRRALARVPHMRAWFLQRGKRPGDAPLLSDADLLYRGRPSFEEDWRAVAYAALRARSDVLRDAVVSEAPSGAGLVRHPYPLQAREADAAVLVVVARGGGDLRHPDVLSWAAVLPDLPDDVADAFLAAVGSLPAAGRRDSPQDALAAVLELGRRSPATWGRLREVMAEAAPWLQDLRAHAQALLDLQGAPRSTHVEIQAVLDALAGRR